MLSKEKRVMTFLKSALTCILLCASMLSRAHAADSVREEYLTTVNNQLGLMRLIRLAVGQSGHVHIDITPEHFPIARKDIRSVRLTLRPAFRGETLEKCHQAP